MSGDDERSVYVGGLSFDTHEDTIRHAFHPFGSIVNAKVVFDQLSGNSRGFGFVTFTTSRAAMKAIDAMNGAVIDGRIVKVNEVRTRNARMSGRDNFRDRDRERDNWDLRNRDRFGNARHFSPPRNRKHSPGGFRSARGHSPIRHRSRSPQGAKSLSNGSSPQVRHNNRSSPSVSPRSPERFNRAEEMPAEPSKASNRGKREREVEPTKLRENLDKRNRKHKELKEKVLSLEDEIKQKDHQITEMQSKTQNLQAVLASSSAATSQRLLQLKKLHMAFIQFKDYSDRIKMSEKELQALVDVAVTNLNMGNTSDEQHNNNLLGNGKFGQEMDCGIDVNIDD